MSFFKVFLTMSLLLSQLQGLTPKEERFVEHVIKSLENADAGVSKIDPAVFSIHGMTGRKVQHLLNNLCSLPGATYLEVGCWKGATLVAALYGNEETLADAMAVENFSQYGDHRDEFFENLQKFIPKAPLRFFNENYFAIDHAAFTQPINIYFYDGGHSFLEQYKAFSDFNSHFDDVFIAVVDDWNWGEVHDGTINAFRDLGYTILFEKTFLTSGNGVPESWWNGIYIAVIKKN